MKRKLVPAFAALAAVAAVAAIQLTTSVGSGRPGAFIVDANTVVNVTFVDGQIYDPYNVWSSSGSIPQDLARRAAGPFATLNDYYYLGSGSDPLDFPGTFTICVAFFADQIAMHPPLQQDSVLAKDGEPGVPGRGWMIRVYGVKVNVALLTMGYSSFDVGPIKLGLNATCFGNAGAYWIGKVNNYPIQSMTFTPGSMTTTQVLTLGAAPTWGASTMKIRALWGSSTPPTEALFNKQIQAMLGH